MYSPVAYQLNASRTIAPRCGSISLASPTPQCKYQQYRTSGDFGDFKRKAPPWGGSSYPCLWNLDGCVDDFTRQFAIIKDTPEFILVRRST
jgi:hypothetical protein